MVSASQRNHFPGTGLDVGLNTSVVIALRAPGFRYSAGTRARAQQQQPGTRGWHSGLMEPLHPANVQHQHSANKREGAYGEVAPPEDVPTARIQDECALWPENPPTRLCLGLPTMPATVAHVYLGPAPPITGSAEALQPGCSASAQHSTRAPPLGKLFSAYAEEPIGWGKKGLASRPAPRAPPFSTSRLSLSSQVGKVASASKLCSCWLQVAKWAIFLHPRRDEMPLRECE